MIKAIFFDIDGTLLSFETHQVSSGTIWAFERLRQKGILTFISSGRPQTLLPQFPISFDGYVLMNGGYCYMGDQVLVRNPIDAEDRWKWLQYVEEHGKSTMAFLENEMYISNLDETCIEINRQMGIPAAPCRPLSEMGDLDVFQFIAVQGAEDDAEVLELLPHCRLPRWHSLFSDLIPADSSKAVGMDRICRHLGIDKSEIMAFGDGSNDIEMLDFAGIGVAMGNASENVKRHADFITSSVDDEGILHALLDLQII